MDRISILMSILVIIAVIICSSVAAPQFGVQRVYTNEVPSPYEYQYKVENPPSNTYYGKSENGDAAGRVSGNYYVYLPDGRLMTVDYIVEGESGFVPKITFANQAYPGLRAK